MEKEKKYDWEELGNLLKSRYRYYHDNAPTPFDKLSFNEVLDFGEISDNVYENPIIRALVLNEGKSLINEAEYATYPINTTINYVSRAVNIPKYMFAKEVIYIMVIGSLKLNRLMKMELNKTLRKQCIYVDIILQEKMCVRIIDIQY